jgi:hypothetical protein
MEGQTMKKEQEKKTTKKVVSRRGKIIDLVQENKWTIKKLAEALGKLNKKWTAEKNRAAITGTLADLKKKDSILFPSTTRFPAIKP